MTFWLLMRFADDWWPVALFRTNDAAIEAGLIWEKSGYPIKISPVSVHETAEAA